MVLPCESRLGTSPPVDDKDMGDQSHSSTLALASHRRTILEVYRKSASVHP